MEPEDRAWLGHRLRGAASELENAETIRSRVDRRESALVVALFLEYARGHGLTPAEAESLLARPGSAGPRALELLGFVDRMQPLPGRREESRATRCGAPPARRAPGR